jgi:hypothetical protein
MSADFADSDFERAHLFLRVDARKEEHRMPDQSDNQLLHTLGQSAARLQRSPRKIRDLIDNGELEAVHEGRSLRVVVASEDALVERLRQQEVERRAAKAKAKGQPAIPATP